MNSRERFIRSVHFEEADRAPHAEQFWSETVRVWHASGNLVSDYRSRDYDPMALLPSDELDYDLICRTHEMDMHPPWNSNSHFYPTEFSPMFKPDILRQSDQWIIVEDEWGITKKVRLDGRSVPQLIDFPVKNPEDFDSVKDRLDPYDPRRFKNGWGERARRTLEDGSAPVNWGMIGFFGVIRWLLGLKGALLAFLKQPWLIRRIFSFWADFVITLAKPALEIQIDYLGIWEDMAYKTGPMISPRTFQELMVPYYRRVTDAFKKYGVDVCIVDSDGNIEKLIPLWLEAGINGFLPLETQAGMDAPSLREKYGDKAIFMGNISLWALRKGPKAIDRELQTKLSALLPDGGYIVSTDHHIPPDVSYQNYLHYVKRVLKWARYKVALH